MKAIFLGPFVHWLLVAALIALGWLAGFEKLHVTAFNTFLIAVIAATMLALVAVLKTAPEGKRVTRDPLEDDQA